jgi:hypothetical protein
MRASRKCSATKTSLRGCVACDKPVTNRNLGGHIKSVSLQGRGASRGKRLFAVDLIRALLREQMEGAK